MRTLPRIFAAVIACIALRANAMPVYVDPQLDTDAVSDEHSFLYRLGERAALRNGRRATQETHCEGQAATGPAAPGAGAQTDCAKEEVAAPAPPGKATSAWQTIKRSLPNLLP